MKMLTRSLKWWKDVQRWVFLRDILMRASWYLLPSLVLIRMRSAKVCRHFVNVVPRFGKYHIFRSIHPMWDVNMNRLYVSTASPVKAALPSFSISIMDSSFQKKCIKNWQIRFRACLKLRVKFLQNRLWIPSAICTSMRKNHYTSAKHALRISVKKAANLIQKLHLHIPITVLKKSLRAAVMVRSMLLNRDFAIRQVSIQN